MLELASYNKLKYYFSASYTDCSSSTSLWRHLYVNPLDCECHNLNCKKKFSLYIMMLHFINLVWLGSIFYISAPLLPPLPYFCYFLIPWKRVALIFSLPIFWCCTCLVAQEETTILWKKNSGEEKILFGLPDIKCCV